MHDAGHQGALKESKSQAGGCQDCDDVHDSWKIFHDAEELDIDLVTETILAASLCLGGARSPMRVFDVVSVSDSIVRCHRGCVHLAFSLM